MKDDDRCGECAGACGMIKGGAVSGLCTGVVVQV